MLKKIFSSLLFCVFSTCLLAQANLQPYVSFKYKNQSLESIFKDIEERYDVIFSYSDLDTLEEIDFKFQGSLGGAVKKLCDENYISFELVGKHIILKNHPPQSRKLKGQIIDIDTKLPLVGATVTVLNSDIIIGTDSDENGLFQIEELPIGRHDLQFQYLGYEPVVVNQVLTSAGKEVFLNIEMQESTLAFQEVIVSASMIDAGKPINDFASTSSRSFSVEETRRFAASISDPARMAQAYAGITSGGDDLSNEIIIRGNSTRGLLWKLEGVEVPNPNHFGGLGNGGGAVSMLSSSTLTNSDFFTGAFPAEYGNALSGVFDLRLRKGNSEKREHSISLGNLGFEGSTEGPIKKGKQASYLVNFRYSTVETIMRFLPDLENRVPAYRDLTFKINVPTDKIGTFSFFGLGGINFTEDKVEKDSAKWKTLDDALAFRDDEQVGVLGLTHRYLISDNAYVKTSLAATHYAYNDLTKFVIKEFNYLDSTIDESRFRNNDLAFYFSFHQKLNPNNKIRTGFSIFKKAFSYDYVTLGESGILGDFDLFFKNKGSTEYFQSYFQWQHRISNRWELNSGLNFSYLALNNTYAIDPRISAQWDFRPRHKIAMAVGLHSKPEHISTYFVERIDVSGAITSPNLNLEMSKAFHLIVGYDFNIFNEWKFKAEAYFQYLFDIPVSENPDNGFSVLNIDDVFDAIFGNDRGRSALVSEGTGENYGLDLTIEKPFSDGYYILATASLYDSKYTTRDGRRYHTGTANNYIFNLLGGKEWKVGRKEKNIFGVNSKFTFYGGRRVTPIDLTASMEQNATVFFEEKYFSDRVPSYLRWDVGISYKINTLRKTHSIHLDIQNVTNRFNTFGRFYSTFSQTIVDDKLNGLIPFLVYRLEW